MLVLLMASTLRDQPPSVVFEQANELAELHASIVPGLSAGPCPERSGEAERRSAYEKFAVRAIPGSAHLRIPACAGILLLGGVAGVVRTG
jgi:hypothetical protein